MYSIHCQVARVWDGGYSSSRELDRNDEVVERQGRLLPGESACTYHRSLMYFAILVLRYHTVAMMGAPSPGACNFALPLIE